MRFPWYLPVLAILFAAVILGPIIVLNARH